MKKVLRLMMVMVAILLLAANSATLAASKKVTATKVALSKTSITLYVGESTKLTATISPSNATDKTLTWSTSNKKVATVSGGQVKAVATGTATITVKTSNGKNATCKVTVKAKPSATSVSLNCKSYAQFIGNTLTLKATVSPSNASTTLTWSSSNKKVATVSSNGVVTPKGYGEAVITVKTSNGKKAECTVKVYKDTPVTVDYNIFDFLSWRMRDRVTLYIDGVSGKINKVSVSQMAYSGLGLTISKKGAEYKISSDKKSVTVTSTYKVSAAFSVGFLDIPTDFAYQYATYRIEKDRSGKFVCNPLSSNCDDLLGICKAM